MSAEIPGQHAFRGEGLDARAQESHVNRRGWTPGGEFRRFRRVGLERRTGAGRARDAVGSSIATRIGRLFPTYEWPTWLVLAGCYGLWIAAVLGFETLGPVGFALLGGYAIALHSSLQHEALHGHPTRSAALNEALVFPSLITLIPYRRMKTLHLRHHRDERLTDPYDDPESYYVAEGDWRRLSWPMQALLTLNGTLSGRMLIGPWLSAFGLFRDDLRSVLSGGRDRAAIVDAYVRHSFGVAIVVSVAVGVGGLAVWEYVVFGVWPGYALLMLRTYAEHKAAENVGERSAIVEAEPLLALLFLNNNLHAVHHAKPTEPWHRLPAIWRAEREAVLRSNGGYHVKGYSTVIWRWMFHRREPVAHPVLRRCGRDQETP